MKFLVYRPGFVWEGQRPCDGAVQERYTRIDERTADDPKKIPLHKGSDGEWWYREGENHRVIDGWITRDFPDEEGWFLDIPDVESLAKLVESERTVEIRRLYTKSPGLTIRLPDNYNG